jgi:hypothetical protein
VPRSRCGEFNYFCSKKWRRKIPLNRNFYLHFLKKESPNFREFATQKTKTPSVIAFWLKVLRCRLGSTNYGDCLPITNYGDSLRITNYGDRLLALVSVAPSSHYQFRGSSSCSSFRLPVACGTGKNRRGEEEFRFSF